MPADLAVLGLGSTGLPLAQAATAAGVGVIGYDPDPATVADINAGRVPPGSLAAADLRRMLACGFRATADPAVLGRVAHRRDLRAHPARRGPRAGPVRGGRGRPRARRAPAPAHHRRPGVGRLPGHHRGVPAAAAGVARPAGRARLPPRLLPRPPRPRQPRLPPRATPPRWSAAAPPRAPRPPPPSTAASPSGSSAPAAPREAEAVKLLETNYRHVNIAFANEMAVFCHDLGVDLWDVIRCAETKPFGFQAFRPGPGVGGPAAPSTPTRHRTSPRPAHPRLPGPPAAHGRTRPGGQLRACRATSCSAPRPCSTSTASRCAAPASCCSASPTRPTSPTSRAPPPGRSAPGCSNSAPNSATTTPTCPSGA